MSALIDESFRCNGTIFFFFSCPINCLMTSEIYLVTQWSGPKTQVGNLCHIRPTTNDS